MSQTLLFVQVINLSGSRIVILCEKMTRVWGRKKIIWVSFCTQQVSCDWQSSSQNYSSRNNPNSRVSFAAEAVLMTCLTAACWSLESALTCRAVNREMRGSIEIKPSLCQQPRVRGSEGLVERAGREAGSEGSAADRDTGGEGSIQSMNTKGCTRELMGWGRGRFDYWDEQKGRGGKRRTGSAACEEVNQQHRSSQAITLLSHPFSSL